MEQIKYNLPECIKLNIFPFDMVLGGFEEGSFIQLVGESSTGKTSIALQLAYKYCLLKKNVIYIDTENSVNIAIINNSGLSDYMDKNFFYIRECTFDKVEKMIDHYIEAYEIDLVIIDSFPSLINKGYLNLDKKGIKIDNNNTNYQSRPSSLFIQKYKAISNTKNISFILINQFRNKINPVLGSVKKRFGVKVLDHASNLIIEIEKIPSKSKYSSFANEFSSLKNGDCYQFNVAKSKSTIPNKKIPFYLLYTKGIWSYCYLAFYMINKKIIIRNGNYYEIPSLSVKENGINNLMKKIETCNLDIKSFAEDYISFYKQYFDV